MTGLATRIASVAKGSNRTALVRYVLVGGFNTLLDIGLFTLFAVVAHIPVLVANVMSTTITLCVSYLLNRMFVFKTERSVQHTLVQFVVVTLFDGLVVQSAVIWAITRLGALTVPHLSHDILAPAAKVCSVGVGMVCNYLGYRWLFATRTPSGTQPTAPEAGVAAASDQRDEER